MIEVWIAAIGGVALVCGALLTFVGVKRAADLSRITVVEDRVDKLSGRNELLWRHNRALIHHIYEGKPPPPPDFPPGLFDD